MFRPPLSSLGLKPPSEGRYDHVPLVRLSFRSPGGHGHERVSGASSEAALLDEETLRAGGRDGRYRSCANPPIGNLSLLHSVSVSTLSSSRPNTCCGAGSSSSTAPPGLAARVNRSRRSVSPIMRRSRAALAGMFGQVLGLYAKAGLVGLNIVAIDGSKIAADASREATATTRVWLAK